MKNKYAKRVQQRRDLLEYRIPTPYAVNTRCDLVTSTFKWAAESLLDRGTAVFSMVESYIIQKTKHTMSGKYVTKAKRAEANSIVTSTPVKFRRFQNG